MGSTINIKQPCFISYKHGEILSHAHARPSETAGGGMGWLGLRQPGGAGVVGIGMMGPVATHLNRVSEFGRGWRWWRDRRHTDDFETRNRRLEEYFSP